MVFYNCFGDHTLRIPKESLGIPKESLGNTTRDDELSTAGTGSDTANQGVVVRGFGEEERLTALFAVSCQHPLAHLISCNILRESKPKKTVERFSFKLDSSYLSFGMLS